MSECCICRKGYSGFGNNSFPLRAQSDGRSCCENCNFNLVIPVRLLCCSLNLKSVAETEAFGKRYLQAWRARDYKRCENLLPDLIKEYRAKAQSGGSV
jgi:hypothetical protein